MIGDCRSWPVFDPTAIRSDLKSGQLVLTYHVKGKNCSSTYFDQIRNFLTMSEIDVLKNSFASLCLILTHNQSIQKDERGFVYAGKLR